jgi:hypothetical protein
LRCGNNKSCTQSEALVKKSDFTEMGKR